MTEYELRLMNVVATLEKIINGAENETVSTNNGQVPTLAGLVKQTRQFTHVLPVIDYKRHVELVADGLADLLKVGQIYRVWGDDDKIKNGFYRVEESNIKLPLKSDYSDIYDLKQNLPNPWNYIDKTVYGSEISTTRVCSWVVGKTGTDSFSQSLEGTLHATSTLSGSESMSQIDFKLMFAYNENFPSRIKQTYAITHNTNLDIGSVIATKPDLKLFAIVEDTTMSDLVKISLFIQQTSNVNLSPYRFDVTLKNYKKSNFLFD